MNQLRLSVYDELYIIDLDNAMYFMADDHYSHVYYASGTHFLIPFGLSKIEERLSAERSGDSFYYIRLGRRYIVNLHRIFYISTAKQQLILSDDHGQNHVLRISKPVLRSLHDMLSNGTNLPK